MTLEVAGISRNSARAARNGPLFTIHYSPFRIPKSVDLPAFCLSPAAYRLLLTAYRLLLQVFRLPPHRRMNARSPARVIEENELFNRAGVEFAILAQFQID